MPSSARRTLGAAVPSVTRLAPPGEAQLILCASVSFSQERLSDPLLRLSCMPRSGACHYPYPILFLF